MEDLQAYRELIEKKAAQGSRDVLPNACKEHASIVMTQLFKLTNTSINMIVGSFDGSVSNDSEYLQELSNAIDRNVSVSILFLENPNVQSEAYKLLLRKKSEHPEYSINIKVASSELVKALYKNNNNKSI